MASFPFFFPTTNGGMQNGNSVGMFTHRVHILARFGADSHAQSVLINKISASELSRKFIKSALSVGLEEEEKSVAVIIRGTT